MKMRSISLMLLVTVLSIIMTANSAWAGSAQHNRWKGVAIGIGATIIGSALYKQHKYYSPQKEYSDLYYGDHQSHPKDHHYHGYWELRKEWVSPIYREVWNPGHYDRRGRWVEGHWIKIEDKPGYWTEKRVWIADRSRRPRR